MAEHVCKIQIPLSALPEFPTPVAAQGMTQKTSNALNSLEYIFEDDKGRFVEIFFDINDNGKSAFIFIKMAATTNDIMQPYLQPYLEIEKQHPMQMEDFYYMDRTIVARQVLKESNQRLVNFFSEKRKGMYFGNFVKAEDVESNK